MPCLWRPIAPLRSSPKAGLTLVELLLALTLFAALLAVSGSLLRSGLRAQLTWGMGLTPYQRLERGVDRLAKEVATAQPLFAVPVTSDGTALEFARATPAWTRVTYRLGEAEGGLALVREESPWSAQPPDSESARQETVLPLTALAFSFGMVNAEGQLVWVESWDGDRHGVPRLVKLDYAVPLAVGQEPLRMSRMVRNPAGALPVLESP